MTKLCIKILVKSDSAIESAFPYSRRQAGNEGAEAALFRTCGSAYRGAVSLCPLGQNMWGGSRPSMIFLTFHACSVTIYRNISIH